MQYYAQKDDVTGEPINMVRKGTPVIVNEVQYFRDIWNHDDMTIAGEIGYYRMDAAKKPPEYKYNAAGNQWTFNGYVFEEGEDFQYKPTDVVKDKKLTKLGRVFASKSIGEYTHSDGKVYSLALQDISYLIMISVAGPSVNLPANGLPVYTVDGEKVEMNKAELKVLVDGITQTLIDIRDVYESKKADIEAMNTSADIDGYDITVGWPN